MRTGINRFVLPLAALTAILAVSTSSIFIRFAQNESIPSMMIAAIRVSLATLFLMPVTLAKHRGDLQQRTKREWGLILAAGLFLALHFATWITSLEYTSLASSVILVSTAPLWVTIFSPIFLGERMRASALIGLTLAVAGGSIIGLGDYCTWTGTIRCEPADQLPQDSFAVWGNFLALAGAWTLSGYLIIGRKLRSNIPLVPYIFGVYGTAAMILTLLVWMSGVSIMDITLAGLGWSFLVALVPQLIGHSLYNYTLKYLPASLVAVTTLGEPIGATILAFIIFKEDPGLATLLGGAFIMSGIYFAAKQS